MSQVEIGDISPYLRLPLRSLAEVKRARAQQRMRPMSGEPHPKKPDGQL